MTLLRFGDFELDEARYELRRAGVTVALERRVFDLIAYLARNCDRVVTKAELFQQIWNGRAVSEGSLPVAMTAARRVLGDDATQQAVIRTYKGRGYRFVKEITASIQVPSGAPSTTAASVIIGRSEQLQTFLNILDSRDAHIGIILISGEPGIGKSRLLTEFAAVASDRGYVPHLVRCPESERTPYLWPCQQFLRRLMLARETELAQLVPVRHARFLASLLPEYVEGESDELSSDPDTARFQIFEAMGLLLRALCDGSRQILAIDDFHRVDETTARFLPFAATELRDSPLLVIGTYRPIEASRSSAVADVIATLLRDPLATHLQLEGLSAQETLALAETFSKTPLSEAATSTLYVRTGGNPFFIRNLVPLMAADHVPHEWSSIPPSISQMVIARIGLLSASTQSLLTEAAVIGREFDTRVLERISRCETIDECLDEAVTAGLVARSQDRANHANFLHILVRDVLYSHLSASEKRRLHLRIGEILDSHGADVSEQRASEIARHYLQSGDAIAIERAVSLGEKAGLAATHRSAHEDACHHLSIALGALRLLDDSTQSRKCQLLLSLGGALCRAGDRSAAKIIFGEAAELASALGASKDLARAALGVAPGILAAEAGVSDASLEQLLRDALTSLDEPADDLRALLAARLAMVIHWSERDFAVSDLMETARDCQLRTSDPEVKLHVLFAEWFCGWTSHAIEVRYALADEIQSLADRIHNREMSLVGMVLRMVGMLERGEIARFDTALACFDESAQLLRQPQSLWYSAMFKGMRALVDGRLDDAANFQHEFAAVAARVNDANAFHSLAAQSVLLHWEKGTLESVLELLAEGARRYPAIRGFRAGLAWSYLKLGQEREATREFEIVAGKTFDDLPQRYDWSAAVFFSSEVAARLGDHKRCRVLYQMLEPYQGRSLVLGLGVAHLGPADRSLGLIAESLGQYERAEWHFERALTVTAGGMPAWNGHAKLDYARFNLRSKRSAHRRASQLVREAYTLACSLDMRTLKRDASDLLKGNFRSIP